MNDSQLEAFVRDKYHQTKNSKNPRTKAPLTYYTSNKNNKAISTSDEKTSGVYPWLERDSSQAQIAANASKVYLDYNKIIYSCNPLVVMVGIEAKQRSDNSSTIIRDYINVKQMLVDIKRFDMVYHNVKHNLVHLRGNNQNSNNTMSSRMIRNEFALKWKVSDLDKFNQQAYHILENGNFDYDCLIYIISSNSLQTKDYLYDSYENKYSYQEKIFEVFKNRKGSKLEKKGNYLLFSRMITRV